jgi:uncharacterized protein YjeT (DUF2065 family)
MKIKGSNFTYTPVHIIGRGLLRDLIELSCRRLRTSGHRDMRRMIVVVWPIQQPLDNVGVVGSLFLNLLCDRWTAMDVRSLKVAFVFKVVKLKEPLWVEVETLSSQRSLPERSLRRFGGGSPGIVTQLTFGADLPEVGFGGLIGLLLDC